MIVEFNHSPEYFKSKSMEKWNRIWKKKIERQRFIFGISIVMLGLSILMVKSSNKMGFVFLSISLSGILITMNFLTEAKKKKKIYTERIKKISDKYCQQHIPISWILQESYLGYRDYQFDFKVNWTAFSHFYVKEKALYIFLKDREEAAYSISEGEIGLDKFNEIVDFVKGKLNSNSNK